jgi:hypothetical protein
MVVLQQLKKAGSIMNNNVFTDLEVSYYSIPLSEEDDLDRTLFEIEPLRVIGQYDPDTIELLKADMIDTAG